MVRSLAIPSIFLEGIFAARGDKTDPKKHRRAAT
jgi:hypothetical protein